MGIPLTEEQANAFLTIRTRRTKEKRLTSSFDLLIATPQTLLGGAAPAASAALAMPANARLAVSSDVPVAAGVVVVNVAGGKVLGTPALAADEVYRIGYVEKGKEVTLEMATATAGTITLYYLDEWKRPNIIATATFT